MIDYKGMSNQTDRRRPGELRSGRINALLKRTLTTDMLPKMAKKEQYLK